jgi:hypothetical protein
MLEALKLLNPNAQSIEWNPDNDFALVDGARVDITQAIRDSQTLEAKKNSERAWRDSELKDSDLQIVQALAGELGRNLNALKTYRQALRDYPNQAGFPDNQRPEL